MNEEQALKGALIASICCPEEFVDRFVAVAARAAAQLPVEVVERIQREIEEMTEVELFDFLRGVFRDG